MRLRDLSVRGKLLLIAMVSSATAISIISVALIIDDQLRARHTLEQEVRILGGVIGDRSTAALSFADQGVAAENLAALALRESITYACIYDAGDQLFASFERREVPRGLACPAAPRADGSHFEPEALIVTRAIELDGQRIGSILLHSDLREIRRRLAQHSSVALLAILLAAGAAFLASFRLQRIISGPLGELAATSRAISEHQDYSVRATKHGDDEVGMLIDAFNTMLATIEEQSSRLIRANESLASTVAELESKNAELERFTYTVSHDLKSPLVTIKGFLGMAKRDAEAGDLERMDSDLNTIHRAADTMAELLEDMLELSRVGQVVGEPECVKFRTLADDAVAALAGRLAESGAHVVLGRLDAEVMVDRRRIVEVLQNLIENGIKFSPGEVPPHIELGQRVTPEGMVFFVSDHGLGIDERYQSKVFEIFERLDVDIPGTGVGLAIVRRIIELHGGRVWVESKGQGHGSTFCMTLPKCDGALAGDTDPPRSAS